jgi:hypothetical protein
MINAVEPERTAAAAPFRVESRRYAKRMEVSARMKKLAETLRKFGPYLTVAIFVPGGVVLAPMMWYARRRMGGAL